MSIFGSVMSRIFGGHAAAAPAASPSSVQSPAPAVPGELAAAPGQTAAPDAAKSEPMQPVDVASVLDGMAAKQSETLSWQTSIVDLMKLLDLDSSLAARKELATELHYTGSTDDSASMNTWLHHEVMQKLAANGGKLPASLQA